MTFEWDEPKNRENIRKHGIDFSDVPSMFDGPMLAGLDLGQDYGEDRWIGIGLMKGLVVVVVFTERRNDVVRIISARKGTKYETKKYQEALKN